MLTAARVLSRIFCLGGEADPEKIFEPRGGKIFLGLLGGSGACCPENFENIVFRIG